MATAPSSPMPAQSSLVQLTKQMARRRRNPPARLSEHDAEELYQHELDTLPRMGTTPVKGVQDFLERLDNATLRVADLSEKYYAEGKEDWWHMADLLDDLSDLRCALRGDIQAGVVRRAAVCQLVALVETPPEPERVVRRIRKPGSVVYTPEEMEARAIMHAELRLERLQNLPLCAGPSIDTAAKFLDRMPGVVSTVADLRTRYEVEPRSDWWHMADLLDDLADLMDAVRGVPSRAIPATLAVVDLP